VRIFLLLIGIALLLTGCLAPEGDDTQNGRELLSQADRQFARREYSAALETYKLAAASAESAGDTASSVAALSQIAHVYALQDQVESGESWLALAQKLATPSSVASWMRFLLARGAYEKAGGDEAAALATYGELFDLSMQTKAHDRALQAAHMAGLVSSGPTRLEWGHKMIAAAEARGSDRWLTDAYFNFGWACEDEGEERLALDAFRSARQHALRVNDPHLILKTSWGHAHGLRMAGQLVEARERAQRALAVAEQNYSQRREKNDAEWIAHCQRELAEVDVAEGNLDLALTRFLTARARFVEAGIRDHAPQSLAELDRRIGQVQRAINERK